MFRLFRHGRGFYLTLGYRLAISCSALFAGRLFNSQEYRFVDFEYSPANDFRVTVFPNCAQAEVNDIHVLPILSDINEVLSMKGAGQRRFGVLIRRTGEEKVSTAV